MDLKSHPLFWPTTAPPGPDHPPLGRHRRADVVIIGGGITGALIARELVGAGHDCLLIDRATIGGGSTSASTALLQYELDTPLDRLRTRLGRAAADRAYRLGVETIDWLATIATPEWELRRRPSLFLARDRRAVPAIRREFEARLEAGLPVRLLDEDGTAARGFRRPAAILSGVGAEMNPYRAAQSLIRGAVRRGLAVHERTEAVGYRPERGAVIVTTDLGYRIRCRTIVFANGYAAVSLLPRGLVRISNTYALVTEPGADLGWWTGRSLVWESGSRYLYARTTADRRIMIGGGDDTTRTAAARDRRIPAKVKLLTARFRLLTGVAVEPALGWAGAFGHSRDGLPYLGHHPSFPRGIFALGFGGNGITFGAMAARMMPGLLAGRKEPEAELFGFGRTRRGSGAA